ncbi:MAG: hypothetical protein ACRD3Y_10070 [Bryobacteraceae bacterium]
MAYHSNRMGRTRRGVLFLLAAGSAMLLGRAQPPGYTPGMSIPNPGKEKNPRLPNGKLRNDAIAREEHKQALKETDQLIATAQQLKAELQKAGDYVVPVSAVRKTKEIERLAKKIRGRLKN